MSKLSDYKTSRLNRITIKWQGETIKFNLFDELKISETALMKEIKLQPSYYGFLLMLHKKLLTKFEDLKLARENRYYTVFLQAKDERNNGRALNDDVCKARAKTDTEYIQLSRQCIKVKDDADAIYSCVKGFEQRKDLLQTLSSNIRKEGF